MRRLAYVSISLAFAAGCTLDPTGLSAPESDAAIDSGADAALGDGGPDAGFDAGPGPDDGGPDAGFDAGPGADGGMDAGVDGGLDAGFDAGMDAGFDGGMDAGFDGGFDAGVDAGFDGGFDAGTDAGFDGGPPCMCPLGCSSTGPGCRVLVPSNVGSRVALDAGSSDVTVNNTWRFDTDNGEILQFNMFSISTIRPDSAGTGLHAGSGIYYEQLSPVGPGADLAVFVMNSLDVPAGDRITAEGSRALVLLVLNDATIDGDIDLSSDDRIAAPGGSNGGQENADGAGPGAGIRGLEGSGTDDGGGGGASHGGTGGTGGRAAEGGAAGSTYGAATLIPLEGGSGGGGGGDNDGGNGGGGGGALQISVGGTLTVNGSIDVGGGGGQGGRRAFMTSDSGAGGGGGSGGAILLEAGTLRVAGTLGANGGAGGRGSRCNSGGCTFREASGEDGNLTNVPADGPGPVGIGGAGGDGSTGAGTTAANGGDNQNGGGAGGGGGRIRLNALTTMMVDTSGSTITPSDGALSTTGTITLTP